MKDPNSKNIGRIIPDVGVAYPQVWSKLLLNADVFGEIATGRVAIPSDKTQNTLAKAMYAENCIRVTTVPVVEEVFVFDDVILFYPPPSNGEKGAYILVCPRTEPEKFLDQGLTPNDVYVRRLFPQRVGITPEHPEVIGEVKLTDLIPNEGSFTSIRLTPRYSISIKFVMGQPQWEVVKFQKNPKPTRQKLDFDLAEDPDEEDRVSDSSYELD